MLLVALILLATAAVLGFVLLGYVLRGKPTPKALAFVHGPIAALGVLLVIVRAFVDGGMVWVAAALLALAAAGGIVLITSDLRGRGPSKALSIAHGATAVAGFGLVLWLLVSSSPH